MATRSVRFDFINPKTQKHLLTSYHDFPVAIIDSDSEKYTDRWNDVDNTVSAIRPFLISQKEILIQRSSKTCTYCDKPTRNVHICPEYVKHGGTRTIFVMTTPHCESKTCHDAFIKEGSLCLTRIIKGSKARAVQIAGLTSGWLMVECQVCDKTEELRKCGGCQLAVYCGPEHQKKDWKNHKEICVAFKKAKSEGWKVGDDLTLLQKYIDI